MFRHLDRLQHGYGKPTVFYAKPIVFNGWWFEMIATIRLTSVMCKSRWLYFLFLCSDFLQIVPYWNCTLIRIYTRIRKIKGFVLLTFLHLQVDLACLGLVYGHTKLNVCWFDLPRFYLTWYQLLRFHWSKCWSKFKISFIEMLGIESENLFDQDQLKSHRFESVINWNSKFHWLKFKPHQWMWF